MKQKSSPHVAINIRKSPSKNHTVINIPPSPPKVIPSRRMMGGTLNNTLKRLSSSPRKPPVRRSPRRSPGKPVVHRKSPVKPMRPLSLRQLDNLTFAPYAINF